MKRDAIIQRAEKTAQKLRMRGRVNNDPLYKEGYKAIMALLGMLSTPQFGGEEDIHD